MIGSPALGAWIAHLAFWGLMLYGWTELGPRRRVIVMGLWCMGLFARSWVAGAALFFAPFIAVLDIAMVFMIFKGDVRI